MKNLEISLHNDFVLRIVHRALLSNHVKSCQENSYELHYSYLKYKDIKLIEPTEEALLKSDNLQKIKAPVLLLEDNKAAESDGCEYYFYYPANDRSLNVVEYLIKWSDFNILYYVEKGYYTKFLLYRAINHCIEKYGNKIAVDFVRDLWKYHWIFEGGVCVSFLAQAWGIKSKEDLKKSFSFIDERFTELENNINYLKEKSNTLDEWIWGLYLLGPDIRLLYLLSENSKDNEIQQINREVDEIFADKRSFLVALSFTKLTQEYIFQDNLSLESIDLNKLENKLRFECNYRTHIPRYWVNKSLNILRTRKSAELEELNHFDPQLKSVINCTEIWLGDGLWKYRNPILFLKAD